MLRLFVEKMKVVGVDVGGSFTDFLLIDTISGEQSIYKVSSTPESQDTAVITGLTKLLERENIRSDDIALIVHGTTVATNAMLQRSGANVCLITTAGLEDVLEIGRQNRQDIYSLHATRPKPLVHRDNRLGISERISSDGQILVSLSDIEIDRITNQLKDMKYDSIAISLLFSFLNPIHEKKLLEEIQKSSSSYVVCSSHVLPEFREYERTSTTVLEAYLGPLVIGYLQKLDLLLKKMFPETKLTVMQSNGGTMLCSRAPGKAVGLAISGLAGGVIGGWHIAKESRIDQIITLDMGGTSCDVSAILGDIVVQPDNEVAGFPIRSPSVDVKTIGAGGGSIAWVDDIGILHVGPQSAGADPGPAAYGRGGTEATVTDANLMLGRLNPDFFLGGNLPLEIDLAEKAVTRIADTINLSTREAALGIIKISSSNMVQAIREVTVERGLDPRSFVLVPFGGAGPTQAIDIASDLGIDSILIPPHPGITSAFGLVCADLRVDLMKSVLLSVDDSHTKDILETFDSLSTEAKARLEQQGANTDEIDVEWMIDMRYKGQSHELQIPIQKEKKNFASTSSKLFENKHEQSYGYRMQDRAIEWVTVRVTARGKQLMVKPHKHECEEDEIPFGTRDVVLEDGSIVPVDIYRKHQLQVGKTITGPAIIEQLDTTTYVAPNWKCVQNIDGTMWLRRAQK